MDSAAIETEPICVYQPVFYKDFVCQDFLKYTFTSPNLARKYVDKLFKHHYGIDDLLWQIAEPTETKHAYGELGKAIFYLNFDHWEDGTLYCLEVFIAEVEIKAELESIP